MERYIPGIVGLVLFVLFAGFLAIKILAPPLQIIIGVVVALAVADFVLQAKRGDI